MTTHKRKHHVVLEITMEQACSQKHACNVVDDIAAGVPLEQLRITKIARSKSLSRVMLAEKLKAEAAR